MGMYDYLNNITKSINNQATENETKTIKKYKNDNTMLLKLEDIIKQYKKNGFDLYNLHIRNEIITNTLEACFGNSFKSNFHYENPEDFINNYELKADRIDAEYCYIFCNKNYDKICKKVENDLQCNDDYKKQIAVEKWEIQKQLMQQKLTAANKKEAERQQIIAAQKKQARQQLLNDLLVISGKVLVFMCKATAYIILAPIFLALCFLGGFAGGMMKLK